ncbi:SOS response-associated peptidase [Corynebacterium qintianiae]|uniref:Abasic site processing protein n=1 Tax=Corynebacterium qintianiae TaxID=2709392 RepID=A0A7T0PFT9_9CORY|nr:SOS response-associated peptidase [Corynebacterium qintianiae]QPK84240.1 SOS response-associated peptidase [Corynebacterium qintianiae]
MCGRFVLFTTGDDLLNEIGALPGVTTVEAPDGTPPPRYNVAPTQQVPLIRFVGEAGETAALDSARWGLLPSWKKDDSGPPLFNARGETVAEKPSFRSAFKARRGLMVLDGYYEWKDKQPYFVTPSEGLLYAAALWETGLDRLSTTMVTTDSVGETMTWLHNRLPLFLTRDDIEQWVAGTSEEALELVHPSRIAGDLSYRPVVKEVGNVRNDYAELIDEV